MDLGQALREADRDAYLATLFAPEAVRDALAALALYHVELDRIVARAREQLAAEVRLQWWRDAIRNEGFGEGAPVPLVVALREAMARYAWPADTLCAISEARIHELYADPFGDLSAFDGYAGEVFAAPLQLAAMALAVEAHGEAEGLGVARAAATAAGFGGVARAAADTVLHERARLSAGRTHIPASVWQEAGSANLQADLAAHAVPAGLEAASAAVIAHGLAADKQMREAIPALPAPLRVALLPAFSAAPVLRAVATNLQRPRLPGPLRRQWQLWRDARGLSRGP